jgi:hypothetical protein
MAGAAMPGLTLLVALACIEASISTFGVAAILHFAHRRRRLPLLVGRIRALSGPFETLGLDALIVAGLVFVSASALKFLAAYWLLDGRFDGAVLQVLLLGVSSIFWYGFALPYGPVFAVPQIILLVVLAPDLH